jgi:mRNA interferase RelE/StbE
MPYTIALASTALRDLERIPPRYAAAILEFLYVTLPSNPARLGKPLRRELDGLYGARRGDYRVIYRVLDDSQSVLVIRVDHRAHIYGRR